jgi:phosphoribosylaminoimidazole-succinocarboxamide synthase
MTGSTSTSIWTQYSQGVRDYCGHRLPDGLRKGDRLPVPLVTPTTKAEDHDELISPADIVARGLMTQAQWDAVSASALALFTHGQQAAQARGLLLVDTKYEFGVDPSSQQPLLIDEIHTPDSSRYWVASTYAQRHAEGLEPENIDKEFLRLWFAQRCDPYKDDQLPPAPPELVAELSRRYVLLYETITGQAFQVPPPDVQGAATREAMKRDVHAALAKLRAPGGALAR